MADGANTGTNTNIQTGTGAGAGVSGAGNATKMVSQILSKLTPDQLKAGLSPEQLSALMGTAQKAGIETKGKVCRVLKDGAIEILITIPSDSAIPLKEWADAAGEPLESFIKAQVQSAIESHVAADWAGAGGPVTVEGPYVGRRVVVATTAPVTPAVGTPAPPPPAAT